MRLWSLHPRYLDRQWLLAVWREGLLAQKVLQNRTKGYRNHPQLIRFRACENPIGAIGFYLSGIVEEARGRGYSFDASKIEGIDRMTRLPVTLWQIVCEKRHLSRKLAIRDPARLACFDSGIPFLHPIFFPVEWVVEEWENINTANNFSVP